MNYRNILERELKDSFMFLHEQANTNVNSRGYGLIKDRMETNAASIASVGFYLGSIPAAVDANIYSKDELHDRVKKTLETFLHNVSHHEGMFAHFVDIETGLRLNECEYSTIDTVILLMGAMTIQYYFDSEIEQLVDALIERANFTAYIVNSKYNTPAISMAYLDPNKAITDENGFSKSTWCMMAEHLMMYFILASHDKFENKLALEMYETMHRQVGAYRSLPFIFETGGPLFIHQYSHAFIDFSQIVDQHQFSWFDNSVNATIANYHYCIDQTKSSTFNQYLWGLTACQSPTGYVVNGSLPCGDHTHTPSHDGTFTICGPLGSILFKEDIVKKTVLHIEDHFPELIGPYGYYDGINLDVPLQQQIVKDYIGINKGISCMMLGNYLYKSSHTQMMEHPMIIKAIKNLKFTTINK